MDTNTEGFVNLMDLENVTLKSVKDDEMVSTFIPFNGSYRSSEGLEILNLLDSEEVDEILNEINRSSWLAVGIDGIKDNYKEGDKIGSYRLSVFNELIADVLYKRLLNFIDKNFIIDESILTDAENDSEWEFVGVNPLFRFIRYNEGGLLVPHYDGSYKPSNDYRSLKTLVLYLEGEKGQGSTRFIEDNQIKSTDKADLDRSDWTRLAESNEVLFTSDVIKGKGLVFDHFMLHDSEPLKEADKRKTIIRTDLMYRRVNNK